MEKDKLVQPFLKWAGGKRQLLDELEKYIPVKYKTYYEPFVGAGALLLYLQPKKAVINDINLELMNCYKVIRDSLDELIEDLKKHKNNSEYYYNIREKDRLEEYKTMSDVEKASRIIYLNKTCYNGLFRVNSLGQYNVPFGNYKNPKILNIDLLKAVHDYLTSNNVILLNEDFEKAVSSAKKGDFVYFDPPYDPVSDSSSFTGYSLNGFNKSEQERLKGTFDKLHKKGCFVLLSNSDTEFIKKLYKDYRIEIVSATRNINSMANKRGKVNELLIMNY